MFQSVAGKNTKDDLQVRKKTPAPGRQALSQLHSGLNPRVDAILHLHHTIGNQAVLRMLQQAKPTGNKLGEQYQKHGDRMVELATRIPESGPAATINAIATAALQRVPLQTGVQLQVSKSPQGSGEPSLADQKATLVKMYARLAAEADRDGWAGFEFTVKNKGNALNPSSVEKIGPQQPRPSGVPILSEKAAASELQSFMEILTEHTGDWKGNFSRDAKTGVMHFQSWSKTGDLPAAAAPAAPPSRLPSKSEEFERETGVKYPPKVNQQLHDIGVKGLHDANPFLLKNLPYTIAGIVVPMGAMKLMAADLDELGNMVRIEWQIDEDAAGANEAVHTPATHKPVSPEPTPPELQVGDIIPSPKGPQEVVKIEPGKLTTRPVKGAGPTEQQLRQGAAELDEGEGAATKKPRKNRGDADDLPKKTKISDQFDKPELEQSPELTERLTEPKDRRRYMDWLKKGHYGKGHPHINPVTNLDGSLQQFSAETGIPLAPKK